MNVHQTYFRKFYRTFNKYKEVLLHCYKCKYINDICSFDTMKY